MISTRGRYALRVLLDLAENAGDGYLPMKDVAARQEISQKYMEQIMPLLTKAGYVRGFRGNNGGYLLAKDPAEYKVGDILRTMEGPLAPIACLEHEPNQCERQATCSTLKFWEGLYQAINDYVDGVTLADLTDNAKK